MADREARSNRFDRTVRLLAALRHQRLPPSIELDDLIQAGRIAVWTAPADFNPRHMRQRIQWAILDSIKGKEYREATRPHLVETHSQTQPDRGRGFESAYKVNQGHSDRYAGNGGPIDPRPNVEARMIAEDQAQAELARRRGKILKLRQAVADSDPENHPLSRRQQKILELRYRQGRSQADIARRMRVTQQGVSYLERRAVESLKFKMKAA